MKAPNLCPYNEEGKVQDYYFHIQLSFFPKCHAAIFFLMKVMSDTNPLHQAVGDLAWWAKELLKSS